MKIAIADADLIGRNQHRKKENNTADYLFDADGRKKVNESTAHRFPNLVCEKISGYHKAAGDEVTLLSDYYGLDAYDKVYVSKVFTDTPYPEWLLALPNVTYGGTGFYYDKAEPLPIDIEHQMPDYHLYDEFIAHEVARKSEEASKTLDVQSSAYEEKVRRIRNDFKEYEEYSIGYMTRGCFRKCSFCVNKKYDHVFPNSSLSEFLDPARKKICLLDDNFLGYPNWKELLTELQATGKPFKFKQGLDERLLTDEKMELLLQSRYDGDMTFAFDRIQDYERIKSKLELIRRHTHKGYMFYLLVGFDETGKYDDEFWYKDIVDAFCRIQLLMSYGCYPYIMRYDYGCEHSPYAGMYINLARYCNTPIAKPVKKLSFNEWLHHPENYKKSPYRYAEKFFSEHPEFRRDHSEYLDMHFVSRGGFAEAEKPEYEQLSLFDLVSA